jgi:hypothetical protein
LRELDATLPATARIRVWLPEQLQGLDAQRLQLSRKIDWQIVRQAAAPQAPRPLPLPRWQSSAESPRDARLAFFRAAYRYWQPDADGAQALPHSNVDTAPAQGTSWLRLSDKPLPAAALDWVHNGGQVVLLPGLARPPGEVQVLWRDESGAPVLAAQAFGQGRLLQWQQALRVENLPVLERADFAERLRAHLESLPAPQRDFSASQTPSNDLPIWPSEPQTLAPWLLWLIAALFALERFLATRPSRQVRV